jgi:zinc protease
LFTTIERTETAPTAVGYVSYRFETVKLSDPDVYPLDLLAAILAQGNTSLLYQELVEKQKVAYSVDVSSYTPTSVGGYFEVQLTLDPKDAQKAENALFAVLEQVKAAPIEAARMDRAKQQQIASDVLSIDTIEDRVSQYGRSMIMTGIPDFFPRYTDQLAQVTSTQVQSTARRYLDRTKMAVVRMVPQDGPKQKKQRVSPTPTAAVPELITLSNGARVVLYHDAAAPKVTAQWFVKGGLLAETPGTNGIGTLVAQLLGKGSRHYTKDDIQVPFENKGAQFSAALGNQSLYASYVSLAGDVPVLLPIFLDAVLHPVFADTELELARRQTLKRIDRRQDDWYSSADYQFRKHFFVDSAYRLPRSGEKDSVSILNVDDLDRYVKQYWAPQDMVLVVAGDFSRQAVLSLISDALGQYKGASPAPAFADTRPLHTQPQVTTGSVVQDVAALFVAYDGLRLSATPEDLVCQDVVDAALSGMRYPGGLLHQLLRSEGLVYLVHGTVFTGIQDGYFLVYALTSTDKMAAAEQLIFEKIDQMKTHLLERVAFDEAIAQVRFAYRSAQASAQEFSTQLATDTLFGRGPGFYQTQMDILKTVTPAAVQKMARRLFTEPQIYRFVGPQQPGVQ